MKLLTLVIFIIVIIVIVQFSKKEKKAKPTSIKSNNSNKPNISKSSISTNTSVKLDYKIDDDFFISDKIFGACSNSSNKKHIIVWNDSNGDTGGYRENGNGKIYIISDKALLKTINSVQRPNSGKIVDNGIFIIEDWLFGNNLSGTLLCFNLNGEVLYKYTVQANILNSDISADGNYAILQTANNDNGEDGNSLIFLDINNKQMLWKIKNQYGWADKYKIDSKERIIYTYFSDNFYRYDFNGNFLDSSKLAKDKEENGNGYELLSIATKKINALSLNKISGEEFTEIEELLKRAINKDISINTKATAYRKLGELYFEFGDKQKALHSFEKAISHNPKIGLKRKIAVLQKEISEKSKNTSNIPLDIPKKVSNIQPESRIFDYSYEPMQIQRQGIQLLESINILNNTKNIDTLKGRFEFITELYPYFVNNFSNKRYFSDIQLAIDEYKTMYYDKVLNDFELALIIKPNKINLLQFYADCLYNCFVRYKDEQLKQIKSLKRQSAIERRYNKITETSEVIINELESHKFAENTILTYSKKIKDINNQTIK